MLDLAWISLAALVLVIVLSLHDSGQSGVRFAGAGLGDRDLRGAALGQRFTIGEVLAGFPTDLFLTLVGVTLLFTLARGNGTLDQVVRAAVRRLPRETPG